MSATLPNCGHCGHFTAGADAYGPWGSACDLEPPDPVVLCGSCAENEYRNHLAAILRNGLPETSRRPTYEPSRAWIRAKGVARGMWRHGLAERPERHERVRYETSGTYQVRYCRCGRPEKHPAHDPREAWRLGTPFCRFELAVARNYGTFHVQEWCACGWTTGRHPYPRGEHPPKVDYLGSGLLMRDHVDRARGHRTRLEVPLRHVFERLVNGEWVEYDPLNEAVPA